MIYRVSAAAASSRKSSDGSNSGSSRSSSSIKTHATEKIHERIAYYATFLTVIFFELMSAASLLLRVGNDGLGYVCMFGNMRAHTYTLSTVLSHFNPSTTKRKKKCMNKWVKYICICIYCIFHISTACICKQEIKKCDG